LSAAVSRRGAPSRSMTGTPTRIRRWRSTSCSRAGTRKPGAGWVACSTSIRIRYSRGYLGVSYAFAGDCEATFANADEAIRLSPRDQLLIIWHLCKGWAALLSERYQEAVELATEAAGANPEVPDIYVCWQRPMAASAMPLSVQHWTNSCGACRA